MQRHFRIKDEDSVKTKRGWPTDGFRRAAFGLEHSTGQVVKFESFCWAAGSSNALFSRQFRFVFFVDEAPHQLDSWLGYL
jgi:hypothetical protein